MNMGELEEALITLGRHEERLISTVIPNYRERCQIHVKKIEKRAGEPKPRDVKREENHYQSHHSMAIPLSCDEIPHIYLLQR
jgi:hypothetical protein